MKLTIRLFLFGMILSICGYFLLRDSNINKVEAQAGEWIEVKPALLEDHLGLIGHISAKSSYILSAPFEGTIEKLYVDQGQTVKKGEKIFSIDPTQLNIQLRDALSAYLKAKKTTEDLSRWETSDDVARTRRSFTNAKNSLADTYTKLADAKQLLEKGIIARMEVDTLEQQIKSQALELAASQEDLNNARNRGQGINAKIADMDFQNTAARYELLEQLLKKQDMLSPFDGLLIAAKKNGEADGTSIQEGAHVAQGAPLFEIVNIDNLEAIAYAQESDLSQIHKDMSVKITGDGFAGIVLNGRVSKVNVTGAYSDTPGTGTTYKITIDLEPLSSETKLLVRLGMTARLDITTYSSPSGIAVPPDSVKTKNDGRSYVLYRTSMETTSVERYVEIKHAVPSGVEVTGLAPGFVFVQ